LIIPRWHETSIWSRFSFRFPYLGVTTLAAVTPPDVDVAITDENVDAVDFREDADLVGITAMTPLAPRGYEIAGRFRERGVPVVMGGVHATCMPEEAARHVDSVVLGEAEGVWPTVVEDARAGTLKSRYQADAFHSLEGIPAARRDLLNPKGYLFLNTVQTTRGCPFDCDFCSVTSFYGNTYRCRPVADVEAELKTLSGGANFVFFVDDNIVGRPAYARELFRTLRHYPFKWLSQASTTFAENGDLLSLAGESRCYGMFVGFETLAQEGLQALNKRHNRAEKYAEVIRRLHDHGMGVLGSFIFGYDWDTKDSFDMVLEFAERSRLDGALFTILTPYPGTRVFDRMKAEGRLLSTDWRLYDMAHAVFRPRNMSVEELQEGYLRVNRSFFSVGSMLRRLPAWRRSLMVFAPMNMGFRKAWKGFSYR
jgi:radical SAM superfamily enzyme YgiQ (UPF0313 family)